ncbi:hypothetical protein ACFOSC_21070 [Streptantibioticus rubrisoli]|uniref:Large membrane protein n=1 Tax=Streptantibioticus rubrisoli TaxID=1387313 RepID=A0ABT1PPT0_9ACTN|nr:hypothetical protein [Streptantibioticus rubrisoli]MCQ4046228.1 hypothetical protein [Streptantibioticus rubrisoli]
MGIKRTPGSRPGNGSPTAAGEPRTRRSRLTVALVTGAVLVAGGSSAYWAASAANGVPGPAAPPGAGATPPPLAMTGWGQGGGVGPGVRYQAIGALPSGPGSAPVQQARGEVSRDEVAKLAAALGVSGPVTLDHGLWRAAPSHNAPGPTLQVTQQAPGSWAFTQDGAGTGCHPATADGGGVDGAGHAVCYSPEDAMRSTAAAVPSPGAAVPPDQAKRAAAPVLAALGLGGAAVDASRAVGGVRTVAVDPVVDGLPTHGWQTTLQVGSDGRLLSGSGRAAPLARGATYPVVNARRALDELNGTDPSEGTGTPAGPCRMMHPGTAPGGPADPGDLPVRPPTGCGTGTPLTLDVRAARFGLSAQFVDGRSQLVPSWLFQVAQPGAQQPVEIAQPAVDPKYVAPSAARSPGTAVHIQSYAVDGRTLTLRFWGGVCSTYSAAVVSQSADSVTVRVTSAAKQPKQICVLLAKLISERVTLDAPLGARKVYDASDGHAVPRSG